MFWSAPRRKRLELEASKAGIPLAELAEAKSVGITLQDAVEEYLKYIDDGLSQGRPE